MNIVVTGGHGYIGSRFINQALFKNHQIFLASRRSSSTVGQQLLFDLEKPLPITLPKHIDVVVHLAANTSSGNHETKNEITAARNFIAASHNVGAKFVFVSSQTASEDAPTSYGRTKWCIEQDVLKAGGLVIRLGQVYGGDERGLFGTLVHLVRHLPVLPNFIPSPLVQPVHVDDCAEGLLRFAEQEGIVSAIYCLASPAPITFKKFMHSIAMHRVHTYRVFIPVPVVIVRLFQNIIGSKLSEKYGLHRLNSLFDLSVMETEPDLDMIDLKLRALTSGMHRSGSDNRRRLINEGNTFLTYLMREKPNSGVLRRYVRMIEKLRGGTPLYLPSWLLRWPTLLVLLDSNSVTNSLQDIEFSWRIDAATVIAEASKQGAIRFLGSSESELPIAALFRIVVAIISGLAWRIVRLFIPSSLLRMP